MFASICVFYVVPLKVSASRLDRRNFCSADGCDIVVLVNYIMSIRTHDNAATSPRRNCAYWQNCSALLEILTGKTVGFLCLFFIALFTNDIHKLSCLDNH